MGHCSNKKQITQTIWRTAKYHVLLMKSLYYYTLFQIYFKFLRRILLLGAISVKIMRTSSLSISISFSMASKKRSDSCSSPHWFRSLVLISFSFEKEHSTVAVETGRVAFILMSLNKNMLWVSCYLNTSSIDLTVLLGHLYVMWNIQINNLDCKSCNAILFILYVDSERLWWWWV